MDSALFNSSSSLLDVAASLSSGSGNGSGNINETLLLPTSSLTLGPHNFTQTDIDYVTSFTTRQTYNSQQQRYAYCGVEWRDFRLMFIQFHGIFSLIVCIFGLITNILNIIVLTRKDMVSPTNVILTGLAVTDMVVMIDYIPFTAHEYIFSSANDDSCTIYTYGWAVFTLFHAHLTVVCHSISIGLTVTLAVWRFIAVSFPQNNQQWCNMQRAQVAMGSCYLFSPIFCIPVYLAFEINTKIETCADKTTSNVYHVTVSRLAKENNRFLEKLNFWVYSVLIKILPCIALTVLSWRLIRALYQTNQRRLALQSQKPDVVFGGRFRTVSVPADRSCDRTSRMLIAVLLLFLITEFPQGILALLSGILGEDFFANCYNNLSEVMDLLALINSAINFILYCTMSRQFRRTFSHLFKPNILNNWIAVPQDATTTATTCV